MDELLDIVNDEDIVVGQEMRSTIHQKGLQHRGVHVFLFLADGKMLVQKRSADRASSPSMLDCSVSEHVKAGESYLEAAMRGMKEELGVEGVEITSLATIKMEYGPGDNEISRIYEGKVTLEQILFDPVEISEVMYMSLEEIKEETAYKKERFCSWFVEIMNWYFHKPTKLIVLKEK
jgi:isopentenyldiphosphate isomerase